MDLSTLPLQLQNNIISYSRPIYPYIDEIEREYNIRELKKIIIQEMLEIDWERFSAIEVTYSIEDV